MKKKALVMLFLGALGCILFLTDGFVSAEQLTPEGLNYTFGEVKVFTLQKKDVVAIAVDAGTTAGCAVDPLNYQMNLTYNQTVKGNKLEIILDDINLPLGRESCIVKKLVNGSFLKQVQIDKNSPSSIKITALFADNAKPQVTTVKRKGIKHEDGTFDLRTYLVLSFNSDTAGRTVVLDPGHGGSDFGAVSNFLCEKDLNLDIGLRARDLLRQKGYDVYMTRTDDTDVPLFDRADAANILNAAVFVSVHNNSMPEDMPEAAKKLYRGTTVLYNAAALRSGKELALIMCDELVARLRTHKYPLQNRPNLVVLNSTWVPAVLAEVSMMPNSHDAKQISQPIYQQIAAEAIAESTDKFLKNAVLASEG